MVRAQFNELITRFGERHPEGDKSLVERAYALAERAHEGQMRKSGDAYITHPLAAAAEACALGMDDVTIAAALCHDVVEDCGVSLKDLAREVSEEVANLVDGVTKVDRLRLDVSDANQAASMRKLLVAVASDVRVLIVKLCDRLHNMRTLGALAPEKARRIATETLNVYAPLAHRLGLHEVKWQLEDLAFATLYPERYAELERLVSLREGDRAERIERLCDVLRAKLSDAGVKAQVTGRAKHLYSVYSKMVIQGRELDDIFDIIGLRVICEQESDCYSVIGVVHRLWPPVAGRFKDFIATPTFNLYQSLHTTVVPDEFGPVEIQVRTPEMHERAEYGIAAHYRYKHERKRGATTLEERRAAIESERSDGSFKHDWVDEVARINVTDPVLYLEALSRELAGDEVYVFTPRGAVITLPAGATAIDFAYAVHTEVGHCAVGARVDGRLASLSAPLRSGVTVEVLTTREAGQPRREWLTFAVTARAKSKIRAWHNARQRADDTEEGKEALWRSLRSLGVRPGQEVDEAIARVSGELGYGDTNALLEALGAQKTSTRQASARVVKHLGERPLAVAQELVVPPSRVRSHARAGVHVGGLDDVLVTMARCCAPVPGDDIIGFVTAGRGVSVHRVECPNVARLSGERLVSVEWCTPGPGIAVVEVEALDRTRLLADITAALSSQRINIVSCRTLTGHDRVARLRFEFELADTSHLEAILAVLRGLDGVYGAHRVTG